MHPLCCIVAISAFFIPLSFATVTVDTPANAIACAATQLSWQGGIAPWSLSILSAASPNPSLVNLAPSNEPSTTWIIDLSPGTSVILLVQDSAGDSGQSSTFSIHARTTLGGGSCDGSSQGTGGGNGTTTVAPPNGGNGKIGSGNSTGTDGGDGNAGDSGPGDGGTQGGSDTSSSPGGSQALPSKGGSQASSPEAHGGSQPTPSQGSDSSSDLSGHNFGPISTASDPSSSTSSPTSFAQSSGQSASASNLKNSASGSSNTNAGIDSLASPTFTLPESVVGPGGQIQPATSVLQSGVPSSGTKQTGLSDNTARKTVKSGPIIGGAIAAIVCVLLAATCVLRRCRRRRPDAPDRLSYPFSVADAEAAVRREMSGRSGYPASNFSSWGNRGDLDERALTPAGAGSSEGQPMWEAGYGTIESRYQAAFTPGHIASSSSIDRNDPTSHRRVHGAIPKSMTDAYQPEPSSPSTAILEEQLHTSDLSEGNAARDFDEILPHVMPSWGTAHDVMAGRRPIVAGYPPPYTSK